MRVLAAVAVALVLAGPAAAAQIDVTARLQHMSSARIAPKGRVGDVAFSVWTIRDRYGRAIGDMILDCRWVTNQFRLCVGQATLPLGTLAVIGASRTAFLGQFAVVGGTGQYLGAHGTLTFNKTGTDRYVLSITYQ